MSSFKIIDDPREWRSLLASLPSDYRDPYFMPEWYEANGGGMLAASFADTGDIVAKCFQLRVIPGTNAKYYDVTSVGYGGPISNVPFPSPSLYDGFAAGWDEYCADMKIVTEFTMLHPAVMPAQLALLSARFFPQAVRPVNLAMIPDRDGIVLHSHGRRDDMRRAMGLTVEFIPPEEFERHYDIVAERKNYAPNWRLTAGFPQRLTAGLSLSRFHTLGAKDDKGNIVAGAAFMAGAGMAFYLYAFDYNEAHGAPTRLLVEGSKWAYQAGANFLMLGGGMKPGDGIDRFKASLGNMRRDLMCVRRVFMPEIYDTLSLGKEQTSFFPAYRAP